MTSAAKVDAFFTEIVVWIWSQSTKNIHYNNQDEMMSSALLTRDELLIIYRLKGHFSHKTDALIS